MTLRSSRTVAVLSSLVLVVGTAVLLSPGATAEPRRTIEQVQAQLDALSTQAEIASEAFNGAQAKLAAVKVSLVAAQRRVSEAQVQVANNQRTAGQIAADAYRNGGMGDGLALLLADNPAQFLEQAATMAQVARVQNTTIRRSQAAQIALAQATVVVQQQQAEAAAAVTQMATNRAEINASVLQTQQVLSQLQAQERARLAAIAAKQKADAAAAAVAARRAAAAAAARAAAVNNAGNGNGGGGNGGPSSSSGGGGTSVSGSGRASDAVSYALAQVGKPYSYNASPPSSWDCSKLTAAAWGHAGVSLTAYSYDQAQQVRRISTSELRPGDLLFYFNGAHHVAMYIGGGQIVEASSPSTGVRVTSAWNSWSSAHFSFAGRPAG